MGFPGSYGHLKVDAETFVAWNVDMVKMDGCSLVAKELAPNYRQFGKLLNKTLAANRPSKGILYSCSWPYYMIHYTKLIPDYREISRTCNMMRTYHDIKPDWSSLVATIDFTGDNEAVITKHVGPGFWNDPDMLLIGNAGLTEDQAQAQFGMWALFPAPLLMSADLRSMDDKFKRILLNREVIAVNQDKVGLPGRRLFHNETLDIWVRQLSPEPGDSSNPCFAIGVLNRRATKDAIQVKLKLSELLVKGDGGHDGQVNYKFRDLLEQTDFKYNFEDGQFLELRVKPTALKLLKAIPIN